MSGSIPNLTFRIEPGYTFKQKLDSPKFEKDNILIGELPKATHLESIFLGKIAEYGNSKKVWLDCEGAHAIYIMGKRRSGKTYTLGIILEGLNSKNWISQAEKKQAVIMLDTMNVFTTIPYNIEEVYNPKSKEMEEFKRWRLESEKFNIILFYPKGSPKPPEGNSKEIAIRPADLDDKDWAALFGMNTYSDPIGQLIADLYEKVVLEGYKDENGKRIPCKQNYTIDDMLNCMDGCEDIQCNYQSDTIRALKARFKAAKRLPVFSETGVDIKEVFVPGQVSILLLRDIEQNLRSLLVGIFVKKIMTLRSISDRYERLAAVNQRQFESLKDVGDNEKANETYKKYKKYEQKTQEGLPRGWIIIDEAHNYMPARGIMPSTEPLKKYVNEGRNLGLSIVVATQNPSALDTSIRRNADILIIHSISMKDDIASAEGMINTLLPESFEFGKDIISSRVFEKLVRSLPIGYAVISNDNVSRLFVTKIRPRITVHGGIEY